MWHYKSEWCRAFFTFSSTNTNQKLKVAYYCFVAALYLHIPSYYCFHIFFYWVSSADPAGDRRKDTKTMRKHSHFRTDKDTDARTRTHAHACTHTHVRTQRKENLSEISPCRVVWSHWGQTVARHPEELPLYLCTATSCNLLLWDKTKLTRPFTADLTVLSDLVH